jgi:glutaredoxin
MKLVKVEKDNCPACNVVGAFLDDTGVEYEKLNIQGSDEEAADKARGILGKLGFFTVPVTVVLDKDGEIVDSAKGADRGKLQELVELVK